MILLFSCTKIVPNSIDILSGIFVVVVKSALSFVTFKPLLIMLIGFVIVNATVCIFLTMKKKMFKQFFLF